MTSTPSKQGFMHRNKWTKKQKYPGYDLSLAKEPQKKIHLQRCHSGWFCFRIRLHCQKDNLDQSLTKNPLKASKVKSFFPRRKTLSSAQSTIWFIPWICCWLWSFTAFVYSHQNDSPWFNTTYSNLKPSNDIQDIPSCNPPQSGSSQREWYVFLLWILYCKFFGYQTSWVSNLFIYSVGYWYIYSNFVQYCLLKL